MEYQMSIFEILDEELHELKKDSNTINKSKVFTDLKEEYKIDMEYIGLKKANVHVNTNCQNKYRVIINSHLKHLKRVNRYKESNIILKHFQEFIKSKEE